jgi:hypothetical protein
MTIKLGTSDKRGELSWLHEPTRDQPSGLEMKLLPKSRINVSTQPVIKILYTEPPKRTENTEKIGFPFYPSEAL